MKFKVGDYVQFVNTPIEYKYIIIDDKMQILFCNDNANTYLVIGENKYLDFGESKPYGDRYSVFWVKESDLMLWNDILTDDRYNFNMKVVCTESDWYIHSSLIPGKVYEIKNGQLIGSDGCRYGRYTSLNELNDDSGVLGRHCHFIEFKGEA